jgi:hypothetical protein
VALNPSVRTTGDLVARTRPPLFYAAWSAVLLQGAVGVGVYLADDGREQSLAIRVAVAVVLVSGARTAPKTFPLGYLGQEHADNPDLPPTLRASQENGGQQALASKNAPGPDPVQSNVWYRS